MNIRLIDVYRRNPYFDDIASTNALENLKRILCQDKTLEIAKRATNGVFAEGIVDSELMLIGEAPGFDEDKNGIPFCGRSGKFLDKLLGDVQLSRKENVYITNAVNWRPDDNRTPTETEILHCLPYLEKHIALQDPKIIATLGATATFALLNRSLKPEDIKFGQYIGKIYKYKNCFSRKEIPVIVLYHPSYMLRSQGTVEKFHEHFVIMKKELEKLTLS